MVVRSWVGPDGSGKTYLISELETDNADLMHASTLSHKIHMHKIPGPLREVMISVERIARGWYLKLRDYFTSKDQIMDRCYVCGIVYSRFWDSEKYSSLLNMFEMRPDEIYQLIPIPGRERPKRNLYDEEDIKWFNEHYYNVLKSEGYKRVDRFEYNFGVVVIWEYKNE